MVTDTKQPGSCTCEPTLIYPPRSNFQNLVSHKRPDLIISKKRVQGYTRKNKVEFACYVCDPEIEDGFLQNKMDMDISKFLNMITSFRN